MSNLRKAAKGLAKGYNLKEEFYNAYSELDKICSAKFGVMKGGALNYISRLNNSRFAKGREEVLRRLRRYGEVQTVLDGLGGDPTSLEGIGKADVKWLRDFIRDIVKKADPLSVYLRRSKSYVARRKWLVALGIVAVAAAAGAAAYFFGWLDPALELVGLK